jgi:hypothetical protein
MKAYTIDPAPVSRPSAPLAADSHDNESTRRAAKSLASLADRASAAWDELERFHRRRVCGLVRRFDHERRPDGSFYQHAADARGLCRRSDSERSLELPAADSHASLVAILGLLPASLATGLGSDVQRPLATVIVWGLFSSMVLSLFVVPVGYRLLVPGLPDRTGEIDGQLGTRFIEPLPDVSARDIVALLDYLKVHEGKADVYQIAEQTGCEFARLIAVVKASEMLDFVDTPGQMVVLTATGKSFAAAAPGNRTTLW